MIKRLESNLTDLAAGLIPWLAPLPSAWLVGSASMKYLAWPVLVAIVAAAIVEGLGLSSVATVLELREYNQSKRKSDPVAPAWLAAILAGVYLVTAISLTVLLDLVPSLAHVAPALFPGLSLTGAVLLALRADHRRRLAAIQAEKAERRMMRADAAHDAGMVAPMRSARTHKAGVPCALCGDNLVSQQALAAHIRWRHTPQPMAASGNGNGHHAQEV